MGTTVNMERGQETQDPRHAAAFADAQRLESQAGLSSASIYNGQGQPTLSTAHQQHQQLHANPTQAAYAPPQLDAL